MSIETATHDLRHVGQSGQERLYRCRSRIQQQATEGENVMGSQGAVWESRITARTLAVDADGSRHVVHVLDPLLVSDDAMRMGIATVRQVSYDHVDPRGQVRESTNNGALCLYLLPEAPVRVGDTWDATLKLHLPFLQQSVDCQHHYRVTEAIRVGDYDCLQVGFASDPIQTQAGLPMAEPMQVELRTEGILWFAPREGFPVRLDMRVQSLSTVGAMVYHTVTETTQQLEAVQERVEA